MWSPISTLGNSIRVILADCYGDGTVWFSFENSEGVHAKVCIDGRNGSPTKHRLFDRARHPSRPGAVLLELGGEEEGGIVPLVSRWLDSAVPHKLTNYGWELIRDSLVRLGEPNLPTGISPCNPHKN